MLNPNAGTEKNVKVSIAPTTGSGGGGSGRPQPGTTDQSRNQSIAGPSQGRNQKSKSIAAKEATASKSQVPKLPICPEGQILTPHGMPCERHIEGRARTRRKPGFRVPLKKEDGNMEAQIIEYNCEFPNRVVVRLEYLMQSTKVRLNDRHYMDDFYGKLLEEERIAMAKATRHRERAEQNRMKKLIIEGIDKDIPPELAYLHKHPVFRVNQMLGRLKTYDTHLALQTMEDDDEITPVEPYEYNGNQFFKHLHDTGDLWVPSIQRLYDEDKFEGKIYRAKLRLLQKRKEEAAEEKVLRILNNVAAQQERELQEADEESMMGGEEDDIDRRPRPPPKKNERPSWLVDFEKDRNVDDEEDAKLNRALKMQTHTTPFSAVDQAVDKIKAKSQKEVTRLSEKIRRSKEREKEREALLELKRHEQEINYLDTFNYEMARIINNYEKRDKHGRVDDLFEKMDRKSRIEEKLEASDGKPTIRKPYERIFEDEEDLKSSGLRGSTRFANEPLFNKLKKVYSVKSSHPFHHFETYDNDLISDYLDAAEDGSELMELGKEVADMYTRELMVTDDHVKYRAEALEKAKAKLKQ